MAQSFDEDQFNAYLKSVGLSSKEAATLVQKRLVLLLIIQDFFQGKLSLDELSGLGQHLDEYPNPSDPSELEEYKRATFAVSELSFEFRRGSQQNEDFSKNWEMMKVRDYYEKYQHLLGEMVK